MRVFRRLSCAVVECAPTRKDAGQRQKEYALPQRACGAQEQAKGGRFAGGETSLGAEVSSPQRACISLASATLLRVPLSFNSSLCLLQNFQCAPGAGRAPPTTVCRRRASLAPKKLNHSHHVNAVKLPPSASAAKRGSVNAARCTSCE